MFQNEKDRYLFEGFCRLMLLVDENAPNENTSRSLCSQTLQSFYDSLAEKSPEKNDYILERRMKNPEIRVMLHLVISFLSVFFRTKPCSSL